MKEEALEKPTNDKIVFGFWVYLMTDLVMFAALFATYENRVRRRLTSDVSGSRRHVAQAPKTSEGLKRRAGTGRSMKGLDVIAALYATLS